MKIVSGLLRSILHTRNRISSKSKLGIAAFAIVSFMLAGGTVAAYARFSYSGAKASVTVNHSTKAEHSGAKDSAPAQLATTSEQNATNVSSNSNLPPYDPRTTSYALQPTPDKPVTPKTQKSLSISPSTITLYKNVNYASGVRSGLMSATIIVGSGDGTAVYYPNSTDNLLTADTFNARATWDMTLDTDYAPLGITNVELSAIAANGTADYVGTLQVTVLPLPSFSVTSTMMTATVDSCPTTITLNNFSGLTYSSGFSASDQPTLSASGSNINLSSASYGTNTVTFTMSCTGYGTYPISLVFTNRYQVVSVSATIMYVNPAYEH